MYVSFVLLLLFLLYKENTEASKWNNVKKRRDVSNVVNSAWMLGSNPHHRVLTTFRFFSVFFLAIFLYVITVISLGIACLITGSLTGVALGGFIEICLIDLWNGAAAIHKQLLIFGRSGTPVHMSALAAEFLHYLFLNKIISKTGYVYKHGTSLARDSDRERWQSSSYAHYLIRCSTLP